MSDERGDKAAVPAQQAQFVDDGIVPIQPHLHLWRCVTCTTVTASELPPANHVCSNPNQYAYPAPASPPARPRDWKDDQQILSVTLRNIERLLHELPPWMLGTPLFKAIEKEIENATNAARF